jgi:miniconductance mechanosensitive channel
MDIEKIREFFNEYTLLTDTLIFLGVILIAYISLLIVRKYLIYIIERIARKSKIRFDDYLIESKTLQRLAYLIPLMIINASTEVLTLPESVESAMSVISEILFILVILLSITAFFNGINGYYETLPISRERPIKGYLQVTNIVVILIGLIVIVGMLTDKSPWAILTGIGALTAVLLLIFRDTILSFVAGIQITGYDLIHRGDWIEVPQYGADGDVMDIALHTVSVQNWDKTITVIPTHKLTEGGFKNWRGMQQSGGRRIKRSVNIDLSSIKFCDKEMVERFRNITLLKDYVDKKIFELETYNKEHGFDDRLPINGRRMTNIGTFRIYVERYLRNHPKVRQDLTCMVRQLKPEPSGLPIEIYTFANDTNWVNYEAIQADIFDHILAVIPQFDLRVFQSPAGGDIKEVASFMKVN